MAEKKSDQKIVSMVKEAHRVAHVALNTVHSRLVESHEVHGLANALISGRHVSAGSDSGREVDHAGGSATNDSMLDEAYGTGGEKSSGSY
jgi:hypothetical protein